MGYFEGVVLKEGHMNLPYRRKLQVLKLVDKGTSGLYFITFVYPSC